MVVKKSASNDRVARSGRGGERESVTALWYSKQQYSYGCTFAQHEATRSAELIELIVFLQVFVAN